MLDYKPSRRLTGVKIEPLLINPNSYLYKDLNPPNYIALTTPYIALLFQSLHSIIYHSGSKPRSMDHIRESKPSPSRRCSDAETWSGGGSV